MVSEGFQSGLKPCGFRGVLEGSETVWFREVLERFQWSLRGFAMGWRNCFREFSNVFFFLQGLAEDLNIKELM